MFGAWGKPAATTQASVFGSTTSAGTFSFNGAKKSATGFLTPGQQSTSASLFSLGGLQKPTTSNLFGGFAAAPLTQQTFSFNTASKPTSIFSGALSNAATAPQSNLFSFNPLQQRQPAALQPNTGFWTQSQQQNQQQQQLLQQQQKQNSVEAFYASLSQPLLFGDERDNIIARLNQLQAMLGTGIGYSALGAVTYTPDNAFSRFRGIAYNVLPTSSESDGLVCLELNRPCSDVQCQKQGLQDHLFRILGGHLNCQLIIEEIRPTASSESSTEVVVKVVERQMSGTSHTIPASDLATFLCSAAIQAQLASQLCVVRVTPELKPTSSELTAYYETPPAGFDTLIWQQARSDNPAPDRLIPVPVVGFTDLKRRHADQKIFEEQQARSVKHLLTVASELRTRQLSISQKVAQLKRKQIELNHRVLKVLTKQIVVRRAGFAISCDEEALRAAVERIWTEIMSPRGLRARIQQLTPTLRASLDAKLSNSVSAPSEQSVSTTEISCGFNSTWWQQTDVVDDLKEYLSQRNEGIKEMRRLLMKLTNTVKFLSEKKSQLSSGAGFHAVDSLNKIPSFGFKLGSI